MIDEEFSHFIKVIAIETFGLNSPKYHAINNDELAIYLAEHRRKSPGVLILHRNGTWRYDPTLPANDPLLS